MSDTFVLAFTGTRTGMTPAQKDAISAPVQAFLNTHGAQLEALHGDCVGADADFDEICRVRGIQTFSRPSTFESTRAKTSAKWLAAPKAPMQRNRDIVAAAHAMLACPPNFEPIASGSGTWATIRFALRAKKPITIVFPDGSVKVQPNA